MHSKRKTVNSRHIDWAAIKADYINGRSVRTIAGQFNVSASTIYRRAGLKGWTRDQTPVRDTDVTMPVSTSEAGMPAAELSQLRDLAAKLRNRLDLLIDGHPSNGGAVMGARESPATLLLKLCQITEKITSMESRMQGADTPTTARLSKQDHEILKRFKSRHGLSG